MINDVIKLQQCESRRFKYHQYHFHHLCILHYHKSTFFVFESINKKQLLNITHDWFSFLHEGKKLQKSFWDIKSYCLKSLDVLYPPFYRVMKKGLEERKVCKKFILLEPNLPFKIQTKRRIKNGCYRLRNLSC